VQGSGREAFSTEIWDWAYNQIPKVAAKYFDVEQAELAAELARELLEIRRESTAKPRDWKAYLFKCLLNTASRFAKRWRKRREVEPSTDDLSLTWESFQGTEEAGATMEFEQKLRTLQQRVSNTDRRFLKQLRECNGNVTHLGRFLGVHRNTIHRRLRKILRTTCPIEIETAHMDGEPPESLERAQLAGTVESPLSTVRQVLRARIILALLDGLTYSEIVRRLGTSRSTIARWRSQFANHGIGGLKAKPAGKKSSPQQARLIRHLRKTPLAKNQSARELARQFGLSKSTAHRVLKLARAGALSSRKTL
jgi:DNA-directed RNA polymerase specialized sigma24 family protein